MPAAKKKIVKQTASKTKAKNNTKAPAKSAKSSPKQSQAKTKPAKATPVKAVATKTFSAKAPLLKAQAAKPAKKKVQGFVATKEIAKLPAGYKPTEKEEYMNKYQLEYFRRKLLDWKKELLSESLETLEHLKEENWNEPDINDRATVETDAALELRTRDRYRKLIGKIDSALRRIETGDYGFCEETGDPIGIKRLEARPTATLTIQAQERHERQEKMYNDDDWKE